MPTATKKKTKGFDPATEQQKFARISQYLSAILPEREEEIKLSLLALVSKQHYIMLGPSGEGKSWLIKSLMDCFQDVVYADKTLTASTEYDDLFGFPNSDAISEGKMVRTFEDTIAAVHVLGLHEIGKCSDILRTTLMEFFNERSIDNYDHKVETPLMSAICSSNELPSKVIGFTNRFALKRVIKALSWNGRESLANSVNEKKMRPIHPDLLISCEELEAAQEYVDNYQLPKAMITAAREVAELVDGVSTIDTRKFLWSMKILKANVFLDGSQPHYGQLKVLQDVFWDNPSKAKNVSTIIDDYISVKVSRLSSAIFEKDT